MTTSSHHLLIIEDDHGVMLGLRDNFAAEGYRVECAAEGNLGLKLALGNKPDVIILDLSLPGLNGFEICAKIRSYDLYMPILMLTSLGREEDILRGLELGADDYVVKPFRIQELLVRVRNFVRRYKTGHPDVFTFGEFRLDRRARTLRKGEELVPLTPKEFGVLSLLTGKAGMAVTRRQILSAVWGSSLAVTQKSVDRCVMSLRGKIGDSSESPRHIISIPKVGYRFQA